MFNALPADVSTFHQDRVARLRNSLQNETHVGAAGELIWNSNNAPVPMDCFRDAFATAPAAQEAAVSANLRAFVAEYRKNDRPMSQEQMCEARAAHGAGTVLVNIITGRRTQL
jgi:hypothetical protein